jgi:hypothetical protein
MSESVTGNLKNGERRREKEASLNRGKEVYHGFHRFHGCSYPRTIRGGQNKVFPHLG